MPSYLIKTIFEALQGSVDKPIRNSRHKRYEIHNRGRIMSDSKRDKSVCVRKQINVTW
jgi:hypothetical protein